MHVHWARLDDPLPRLGALLSADERRRAAAHRWEPDRLRSAAAAALLRVVAGRYLGLTPRDVPVTRSCDRCGGTHGLPRIDALPRLRLSVAHSGTCAALAVALDTAIGIDIEALDVALGADEILRAAAAPGEVIGVRTAGPETDRRQQALALWTRKEAVLKAAGTGLAGGPTSIVTGGPDRAPRVTSWPHAPQLVPRLRLRALRPPAGHVATVAVVGDLQAVVARDATDLVRAAAAAWPPSRSGAGLRGPSSWPGGTRASSPGPPRTPAANPGGRACLPDSGVASCAPHRGYEPSAVFAIAGSRTQSLRAHQRLTPGDLR